MALTKPWQQYCKFLFMHHPPQNTGNTKRWLRRIGVAGFVFFLAKGLVWVGVAVWAGKTLFD